MLKFTPWRYSGNSLFENDDHSANSGGDGVGVGVVVVIVTMAMVSSELEFFFARMVSPIVTIK